MRNCERCQVCNTYTDDRLCPRCREFIDLRTKYEAQTKQFDQLVDALVICVDEVEEFGDEDERLLVVLAATLARKIIAAREAG